MSRVSAIVPTRNHARFLAGFFHGLYGAAERSGLVSEIIVIDDASTDDTAEQLRKWRKDSPVPMSVHSFHQCHGPNAAMNWGAKMSTGEFLCFPNTDDVLIGNLFLAGVEMLDRYPRSAMFSGCSLWSCLETDAHWVNRVAVAGQQFLTPEECVAHSAKGLLRLNPPAGMFRRKPFEEVGGWRADMHMTSDWFLLACLAFRYGVCVDSHIYARVAINPSSYYHTAPRRVLVEAMGRALDLLSQPEWQDVADRVKRGGFLGSTDPDMAFRNLRHWRFMTSRPFWRNLAIRTMHMTARRILPASWQRWIAFRASP